jgi:pyruvate ferredoxin oxidoreductase beta subunit
MRAVRFHGRGGQGAVTPSSILARKLVEGYLTLQGRFRHLFEPTRQDEPIRHIQERVDAYWKQVNG